MPLFSFALSFLITANLAVNYGRPDLPLLPVADHSRSRLPEHRRSRLSIQHRATYAFVRCIFMRMIIFFLFLFRPPPSIPDSGRIQGSRLTRFSRSLSPCPGIRNKGTEVRPRRSAPNPGFCGSLRAGGKEAARRRSNSFCRAAGRAYLERREMAGEGKKEAIATRLATRALN